MKCLPREKKSMVGATVLTGARNDPERGESASLVLTTPGFERSFEGGGFDFEAFREAGMNAVILVLGVSCEFSSGTSEDGLATLSQLSDSITTPGSSIEDFRPPPSTRGGFGSGGAALGAGSFNSIETSDEAPAPRVGTSVRGLFASGTLLSSSSAGSRASTLTLMGPPFLRLDLLVGGGNCSPLVKPCFCWGAKAVCGVIIR